MTAQQLVDAYILSAKGLTPERAKKLKAAAGRTRVPLSEVLALLSTDERAKVEAA